MTEWYDTADKFFETKPAFFCFQKKRIVRKLIKKIWKNVQLFIFDNHFLNRLFTHRHFFRFFGKPKKVSQIFEKHWNGTLWVSYAGKTVRFGGKWPIIRNPQFLSKKTLFCDVLWKLSIREDLQGIVDTDIWTPIFGPSNCVAVRHM